METAAMRSRAGASGRMTPVTTTGKTATAQPRPAGRLLRSRRLACPARRRVAWPMMKMTPTRRTQRRIRPRLPLPSGCPTAIPTPSCPPTWAISILMRRRTSPPLCPTTPPTIITPAGGCRACRCTRRAPLAAAEVPLPARRAAVTGRRHGSPRAMCCRWRWGIRRMSSRERERGGLREGEGERSFGCFYWAICPAQLPLCLMSCVSVCAL
mmetsp:Transcript_18888/g.45490  ORF Transcript_18888/g.45490 Transcript_18888/m.45490 type:complete len:211 (-) Transcript_18888:204-836(-)